MSMVDAEDVRFPRRGDRESPGSGRSAREPRVWRTLPRSSPPPGTMAEPRVGAERRPDLDNPRAHPSSPPEATIPLSPNAGEETHPLHQACSFFLGSTLYGSVGVTNRVEQAIELRP